MKGVQILLEELKCIKCGETIDKKKDLIVTSRFFFNFGIYHKDCFNEAYKQGTDYVGRPVNNAAATIGLLIILAIALAFYISTRDPLLLLVLVISPIYRLYIWFKFERLLKA